MSGTQFSARAFTRRREESERRQRLQRRANDDRRPFLVLEIGLPPFWIHLDSDGWHRLIGRCYGPLEFVVKLWSWEFAVDLDLYSGAGRIEVECHGFPDERIYGLQWQELLGRAT